MSRALPIALALFTAVLSAAGQSRTPSFLDDAADPTRLDTPHLQARVEGAVRVGADGRGAVTLAVAPKPKMHLYAADAEGYVPFTLRVEPAAAMTLGRITYPRAEIYIFPPTGESSRAYIKPFKVTQPFALGAEARRTLAATGKVAGVAQVRYQACDDLVCYRPATGAVSFDIVR
jgi:hypothetical protein